MFFKNKKAKKYIWALIFTVLPTALFAISELTPIAWYDFFGQAAKEIEKSLGTAAQETSKAAEQVGKGLETGAVAVKTEVEKVPGLIAQGASNAVDEIKKTTIDLFTDEQALAERTAAFNKALSEVTTNDPTQPGHRSLVIHYGQGIYTIDPTFLALRQTTLDMIELAYASGKVLIYQRWGGDEPSNLQKTKRDNYLNQYRAEGWEFKEIQGESGVVKAYPDVMGIVAFNPGLKVLYVAYRGSVDVSDWEVNFDTYRIPASELNFSHPGTFHRGYLRKYLSGRQTLMDALTYFAGQMTPEIRKHLKIIISGHSKGGGLASVAIADIGKNYNSLFFGENYKNAERNQIYGWLLSGSRATDVEAADYVNTEFGIYNVVRQNAMHDPVPEAPFDSTGHEATADIPLIGDLHKSYSGYKSLGVLALAEAFNDTVQKELDKNIQSQKDKIASEFNFTNQIQGIVGIGTSLIAPIHHGGVPEGEITAFSKETVDMGLQRLLFDGWYIERKFYQTNNKPFPFNDPFGSFYAFPDKVAEPLPAPKPEQDKPVAEEIPSVPQIPSEPTPLPEPDSNDETEATEIPPKPHEEVPSAPQIPLELAPLPEPDSNNQTVAPEIPPVSRVEKPAETFEISEAAVGNEDNVDELSEPQIEQTLPNIFEIATPKESSTRERESSPELTTESSPQQAVAQIKQSYEISDDLKNEFLGRQFVAVTAKGITENPDLRDLVAEEMKQISQQQLRGMQGLGEGLAPLTRKLEETYPALKFGWMITSAIEANQKAGAKHCADKFVKDSSLKTMLDTPRSNYAVAQNTLINKRVDPRNGYVVDEKQKQYCGVILVTQK